MTILVTTNTSNQFAKDENRRQNLKTQFFIYRPVS